METVVEEKSSGTAANATGTSSSLLSDPVPGRQTSELPAWWVEGQLESWKRFQSLPMPKRKDEDWRFATIQSLELGPYVLPDPTPESFREQILNASKADFETAGHAVFANDELLSFSAISADLAARGVIFEPISSALRKHPDLLKKHFMEQPVVLGSEKFSALHRARCCDGILLYVPKNVAVELPLAAWHWMTGRNSSVFPHTLIVAGDNSSVTFADFYRSLDETPGFACSVSDLIVGQGARVNYLCCQTWSESVLTFQMCSTHVGKDANAKSLNFNLGGSFARIESHSRLAGPGARSEMLGLSACHGRQEFDQRTLQDHIEPNTWSDLLYKNTLNHRAKTIFEGLIKVEPGAKQTDAYQTNRNLLLSADAEADSMPGLEIRNDDVKCSHGATTGQIDFEELFYMQTRGIPRHEADYLISVGFAEEVLSRFGRPEISAQLRGLIAEKFLRSRGISVDAVAEGGIDETNVRSLQGTE
ncbi:MAG: Fe-S cluster assembly protein SufD [Methylacidiphilales bacterium]|nr:Fe-S cluster assembly protein SufD [Candidatus Methylacidiphilales bacterium]